MRNTYIQAVIACLLWSTAFAGVKTGLQYAPPLFFAGIRFMLAGILALVFSKQVHGFIPFLRRHWRISLLVGTFQTGIMYGLYFNGVNLLPAAIAAIIIGAGPLITAVTTHFTIDDDRLSLQKTISLIIALAGVILISAGRNSATSAQGTELFGIILLLLSSFVNAISQVIVKKHPCNPILLNASQIFLGGFILFIASLFVEGPPAFNLPLTFYSALLWLSFVSGYAFSIWYTLLQDPAIKVSEINIFKFIIPVSGAILSWILFPNDNPDLFSVIGMGIIASSVIMFFAKSRTTEPLDTSVR